MEEKKYLNEEEYQKNIGFGSSALNNNIDSAEYQSLGGMGLFAIGGLLDTFGFFIAGIGGMLLFISQKWNYCL